MSMQLRKNYIPTLVPTPSVCYTMGKPRASKKLGVNVSALQLWDVRRMTATVDNPATSTNDEQEVWFAQFGYTDGPDQMVTLRGGLGTARAGDVWEVLQGLRRLDRENHNLFQRLTYWTEANRKPMDPDRLFGLAEYGGLTVAHGKQAGEWFEERRVIVAALTEYDDDEVVGRFHEAPLSAV